MSEGYPDIMPSVLVSEIGGHKRERRDATEAGADSEGYSKMLHCWP